MGRIFLTLGAVLLALLMLPSVGHTHLTPGAQTRDIVLVQGDGSTLIYIRTPLPLVFADEIAAAAQDSRPLASPFLYFEQTGAGARYRVDTDAIAQDRDGFSQRLLNSLIFVGVNQPARMVDFRLSSRRPDTPLDNAETARSAMEIPSTRLDPVFAESVVEYVLSFPARSRIRAVQSGFPSINLPEGVTIDTHLARDVGHSVYDVTHEGQMQVPVAFPTAPGDVLFDGVAARFKPIAAIVGVLIFAACLASWFGWPRRSA